MAHADATAPSRGRRLDPRLQVVLLAAMATLAVFPFDGVVGAAARSLVLGEDLEGELHMLQRYGQFGTTLLASILIVLLDPRGRRTLWDWWVALGLSSLVCHTLKMTLGRPRPKLGDAYALTLPWESYVRERIEGPEIIRAFDFDGAVLWSMPSSHTAAAVVMSVFLARMYPRLLPFAAIMAIVVGAARVILGQHFPSDVVVGGAVGWLAADAVWRTRLGQRVVARLRRSRGA